MEGWNQSKFDAALTAKIERSKSTAAQVINRAAYFVARKALWYTKTANAGQIRTDLNRTITVNRSTESGRSESIEAPLAAIIINARRGAKGQPGLEGSEMRDAVRRFIAARVRSVGFIRAGWIPAIKALDPKVVDRQGAAPFPAEANRSRWSAKQIGDARPAQVGEFPVAIIENAAIASHDKQNALQRYGSRALDMAFYDEERSIMEYLEKQEQKDFERTNAQLS